MSRYHRVRPSKHKHKHQHPATAEATAGRQVPQPAAPAQSASAKAAADRPPMPTEAQMETVARDRAKAVFDEVYKLRNGLVLDASIARWKKSLELFDREQETVASEDGSKQHRWTISPSIAFRVDKLLRELLAEQEQLKAECLHEARQILEQFMRDHAPKGDSLCPPKQAESAPMAGKGTVPVSADGDIRNPAKPAGGNRDCPPGAQARPAPAAA